MSSRRTLQRRWIIATVVLAFFAALAGMMVLRESAEPEIDLSREEEPFRSLKLPITDVSVGYFVADVGGTITRKCQGPNVFITDATGEQTSICFPRTTVTGRDPYREALYEFRPMKDSMRAKEICLHLLRKQDPPPTGQYYYELAGKRPPLRLIEQVRKILGLP